MGVSDSCVGGSAGLPKGQQAAFDNFGFEAFERAVAFSDAVAAFHIELPLVLGAGQGRALECQLGDVGAAVRAAAVIDLIAFFVSIDEETAACAFSAGDLAIFDRRAG